MVTATATAHARARCVLVTLFGGLSDRKLMAPLTASRQENMTRLYPAHLSSLVRALAGALGVGAIVLALSAGVAVQEPQATSVPASRAEPAWQLDPRAPLSMEQEGWVERTLAAMSVEEKVGQILMLRAFGEYYAADSDTRQELEGLVRDLSPGGVVLFRSEVYAGAALLDDLQTVAAEAGDVPLIMAADFEWGADFRINGAVPFPTAMAIGATFNEEAAEWMGRASARDARAMGLHWIFAPVADVNVDPSNPVINVRAFGEDPQHVGNMVEAFIAGAQSGGVLATAKHFPGHGDTSVDSHVGLPVLAHDNARLQAVELAPFRRAIGAGVASVMTAHMAVPAFTADHELPATLSHAVLTDLLRNDMSFAGLVVTDAMEMGGITRRWWSGAAAVAAVAAGSDMVLLPPQPRAVHAALVSAVRRGELPAARLDEAVRRVLQAKARLRLHAATGEVDVLGRLPDHFGPSGEAVSAQQVADDAVTLLRDRDRILPLDARRWQKVVVVGVSDSDQPAPTEEFVTALGESLASVESFSIDGRTRGDDAADIVAAAAKAGVVVMAVRVRVRTSSGRISLPDRQARYAAMLARLEVPTVVVALGSPYTVAAFADASTVLATYGWSAPLQRAAARAMMGEIAVQGRLPVSVPGEYGRGDGLIRAPLDATLRTRDGRAAGDEVAAPDLTEARAILSRWVDQGAFPGAVFAVGHRSELVGLGAVGRMSAEPDAAPMPVDALFDLASLTKVVATTPVAMHAVERGYLRLDYPVSEIVPEFAGAGRDPVTIRHLLTHTSGLPAYVEFYREFDADRITPAARARILERIFAASLEAAPGQRYAYSDLGIILLGEVLTRALGEPYWEYAAREIFAPLGMTDTQWNPPPELLPRIPPTEVDPWRGRLVRGEVHDENAHAMGGLSSHAGLFSTARDLAIYAQTLLNLGTYDHQRVLSRARISRWRARQEIVAGSSRGLGWDTAAESGRWSMFPPEAFGHTGFTGTSLWLDPSRELFVVLLTNRVYPTRENSKHVQARIDFHTEVVRAVDRAGAAR